MPFDAPTNAFAPGRRRALRLLAAAALAPAAPLSAQPLAPTPSQPEGPFYPRQFPSDSDADLTKVVGRAGTARGQRLYLSGRVLDRDGRPVSGAKIELWQCDSYGRYHHAGDDGSPRDDDFQGYGVVITDAEGRYAFKTIRPVPYGGRPPHLHVKVRATGAGTMTTQLYVAGDPVGGDAIVRATPRGTIERLTLKLAPAAGREPDAVAATFEFVV